MLATRPLSALLCGFALCLFASGCAESPAPETTAATDEHDHDHEHGEEGHDHSHEVDTEKVLASLTAHEQEIAKAQDMKCIVAGEPLGSMGKPVLVKDVKGHDFLICCEGCEEELRKDPEKYIAKLEPSAEPAAETPAESAPAEEPAADPS